MELSAGDDELIVRGMPMRIRFDYFIFKFILMVVRKNWGLKKMQKPDMYYK